MLCTVERSSHVANELGCFYAFLYYVASSDKVYLLLASCDCDIISLTTEGTVAFQSQVFQCAGTSLTFISSRGSHSHVAGIIWDITYCALQTYTWLNRLAFYISRMQVLSDVVLDRDMTSFQGMESHCWTGLRCWHTCCWWSTPWERPCWFCHWHTNAFSQTTGHT